MFGEMLLKERELQNITVSELSLRSNIPENVIEKLENNILFPNIYQLSKISKALGKHTGYFLSNFIYGR